MTTDDTVFIRCFGQITAPSLDRQKQHSLLDIIAITICAAIAGAEVQLADCGLRTGARRSIADYED